MNSKSMTDFMKPTIITAQQYGTKISVEIDHSDLNLDEVMDAFQTLIIGLGYHENSFKNWVIDRAQEYNETDAEDLKQKLEAWKFEDDDIVLRHAYENREELENDFFGEWTDDDKGEYTTKCYCGHTGYCDCGPEDEDSYRATQEDEDEFSKDGGFDGKPHFEWGDEPEEDYDGQFEDWKNETPEDDTLFEGDEWKSNQKLVQANERYKKEVKKMNSKKRNNK